jgi:hypothetical protein
MIFAGSALCGAAPARLPGKSSGSLLSYCSIFFPLGEDPAEILAFMTKTVPYIGRIAKFNQQ